MKSYFIFEFKLRGGINCELRGVRFRIRQEFANYERIRKIINT
jgi:hypothetical protein